MRKFLVAVGLSAGLILANATPAFAHHSTMDADVTLPRTGLPIWLLALGLVVFLTGGVALVASKLPRGTSV